MQDLSFHNGEDSSQCLLACDITAFHKTTWCHNPEDLDFKASGCWGHLGYDTTWWCGWRQNGPQKRWYPTSLQSATTQKTVTWIFIATKIKSLTNLLHLWQMKNFCFYIMY